MGAPLLNVLVGAAMVLSALAFGKHRAALSKRSRLPYLLRPRFFLISSLLEKLDKLPEVVGSLYWSDFEIQLSSVLLVIRLRLEEVVGTEEPTTQLHRDIISCGDDDGTGNPSIPGPEWKSKLEQLTALMDGQLVPLLRSQPGLAQLFRQYVPAERQSWHEFVEQVLPSDDERQIILFYLFLPCTSMASLVGFAGSRERQALAHWHEEPRFFFGFALNHAPFPTSEEGKK